MADFSNSLVVSGN